MNNVYIEKINLKNFQSWKNNTINLVNGFNVIRSEDNNVGKSVIMKAIKVALCPSMFNRDSRQSLIREDSEYAEAIFIFSDGTASMVRVLPTKTLHYYYDSQSWEQQQDVPFQQTVRKIGGIVDYNTSFIANLLDMDQPLLLVESNDKCNHSLIELITHHEELSKLTPLFRSKWLDYTEKRTELNYVVKSLESQVNNSQFVDVNKMKREIEQAEDLLPVLSTLVDCAIILENSTQFTKDVKDFDFLLEILESLEPLIKANSLELKVPKEIPEQIDMALDTMKSCMELSKLLDVEVPKELDEVVVDAANVLVELEKSNRLLDLKVANADYINILDSLLNIRDNLVDIKEEYSNDILGVRKYLINCHSLLNDINVNVRAINKSDFEIGNIEQELKVKGAGAICPIYGEITIKDNKCYNLIHSN